MGVKSNLVRIICMASLVCLAIGPVALIYVTTALLHTDSLYQPSTCTVVNMSSEDDVCHCGDKLSGCNIKQHCVKIQVKLDVNTVLLRHDPPKLSDKDEKKSEEDEEEEDDEDESYTMCSMSDCSQQIYGDVEECEPSKCSQMNSSKTQSSMDEILKNFNNTANPNITCYVNAEDTSHALWSIAKEEKELSRLVGPLVVISAGIILAVAAAILIRSTGND